jgi:(R,R)-butanediol dehydrogenase / meso-butanediol dehydrogenase / diacetyl reductase
MKALRFAGEREASLMDKPDPTPGPGEVLIRMTAAGICGSDLHRYRAPKAQAAALIDVVPGHEPVGVVAETGPGVRGLSVGDRVVVYHRRGCGRCRFCLRGQMNLCMEGSRRGHGWGSQGSDSELMITDDRCCYVLPDSVSDDVGLMMSCQAGTAYWPLRRLGVSGADTVAVIGLGPVGLCTVLYARALGARVVGLDPSEPRRQMAAAFGASKTIDPTAEKPADAIKAIASEGADVVLETSGQPSGQATIPEIAGYEARAGVLGMGSNEPSINLTRLIWRNLTVMGFNFFPNALVPELIAFTQSHQVPIESVITHRIPFAEALPALALADRAVTGKVMFTF